MEPPLGEPLTATLRDQLSDRRQRLVDVVDRVGQAPDLLRLLLEVDSALKRIDHGSFGLCEVCHGTVDEPFLKANPLIQYCLCNLNADQQRALERDLDLAARTQWALLPPQDLAYAGFETHFRFAPAGAVSGDYCDLLAREGAAGGLYFAVGDVSGKGVAASFLMARLNALFRTLIDTGEPLEMVVERANRLFSEATMPSHYATLVLGRALPSGEVELVNAGHCPPLLVGRHGITPMPSSGLPMGLMTPGPYELHRVRLEPGDFLFLYTDGLSEAMDAGDNEYGLDRLTRLLEKHRGVPPAVLAASCLGDLATHQAGAPRADDLTVLIVKRSA